MTAATVETPATAAATPASQAGHALQACRSEVEVECRQCGRVTVGAANKKFCSRRCLRRAYRQRHAQARQAERIARKVEAFALKCDLHLHVDRDVQSFIDDHGNRWLLLGRNPTVPPREHVTVFADYSELLRPLADLRTVAAAAP